MKGLLKNVGGVLLGLLVGCCLALAVGSVATRALEISTLPSPPDFTTAEMDMRVRDYAQVHFNACAECQASEIERPLECYMAAIENAKHVGYWKYIGYAGTNTLWDYRGTCMRPYYWNRYKQCWNSR